MNKFSLTFKIVLREALDYKKGERDARAEANALAPAQSQRCVISLVFSSTCGEFDVSYVVSYVLYIFFCDVIMCMIP